MIEFVQATTTQNSPKFVPPPARERSGLVVVRGTFQSGSELGQRAD
jgi:hypothetical protein